MSRETQKADSTSHRAELFGEWSTMDGLRWYDADNVDMALNLLEERVEDAEAERDRYKAALWDICGGWYGREVAEAASNALRADNGRDTPKEPTEKP